VKAKQAHHWATLLRNVFVFQDSPLESLCRLPSQVGHYRGFTDSPVREQLSQAGGDLFCTVGEQLAAPGLAIKQLGQKVGDFAFAGAGVEQSPACFRWKRDDPGSAAALMASAMLGGYG